MQSIKKKTEGFTIIEVMIVLVIAAVIILIVFLAVPALQRNSRNNQRKNDMSRVGAAVTEAANNANGTLPTAYTEVSGLTGNLGFYTYPSGNLSTATGNVTNNLDVNTFIVYKSATCSGANAIVGSGRQFAILYSVETGSSTPSYQCIQG
jgi:prepilin-type N-terminal cleavage/methylation domain-containing protein